MQLTMLAFALAAPLQDTAGTQSDVTSFPISNASDRFAAVQHDLDAAGTLWLRGRDYKASADSTGFAFHPFLGSDAPRNFPVDFRLRSAARDGAALHVDQEAEVHRAEDRIVIDRGDVQVRYDVAPDQVEQSFAMEIPEGSGPLVLTLDVETELVAQEHAGGFRFANEFGGVTYGAAVAIGSRGHSVEVPAVWRDGRIQLSVPATFLADAASPIIVDPILSTFSVGTSTVDLGAPDLAYGGPNTIFSVLYEERFSATDVDVYVTRIADDGTTSLGAYVDMTSTAWEGPVMSQTSSALYTLIVAEAPSALVPGSRDIVARRRDPDGTFDAPFVLKSATASYSCINPTIGGDFYYQAIGYCIAYNRDYGAHRDVYAVVTGGSPSTSVTEIALAASTTEDDSAPAINKVMALLTAEVDWVIAWVGRDLVTGASRIQSKSVNYSGSPVFGPYTVAAPTTSALYFDLNVSDRTDGFPLDGGRAYYAVTYDDRPSNESDAFVALYNGSSVFDTIELQVVEHADRSVNRDNVVTATGPGHFMLGYLEEGSLYVTTMEPTFNALGIIERRIPVGGPNIVNGSLAALGRLREFTGSIEGRSLFAWSEDVGGSTEIRGAFVTLPAARNAGGKQYCYGEPNSTGERGFLHALGSRIPGFDHELRVESLPPGNFGYFLASLNPDYALGVGGSQGALCVGGDVGRFGIFQTGPDGTFARVLDTNAIPQPTGPAIALANQLWHFQCWHRDGVGGVATSNFTNGTTIQFR